VDAAELHSRRVGEKRMAHMAAGRVVQLDLLQMKSRIWHWQSLEIPDMVVVHMREHDVLDGAAVLAEQGKGFHRRPRDCESAAPVRACGCL